MPRPFVTGYQGYFNPGQSAVIAAGQQSSVPINTGGMSLAGLILPSLFTGTAITFEVGDSLDGFQASGQAIFAGPTTDGDTLTINGVALTFVDASPGPLEILIGADEEETVANLQDFLSATDDEDLLECTYVSAGAGLLVTAVEHGTDGNSIVFAKSSSDITLTPSGGTLSGGGFRPLYTAANALVTMTVAAGRAYAVDPNNFHGVSFLKIKSGSVEAVARTLTASLKGV